ncbi:MAG: SCO6745 family protein [Ilumatobacteraceae bacterium]
MSDVTPIDARRTWRNLEAVHGMIYFTPHAGPEYDRVGVSNQRTGYFASRAAAMGAVEAEVVIATFFNFNPSLVRHAMDGVWSITTPEAMLEARLRAVDVSLRSAFDDDLLASADLARTAADVREAALLACEFTSGRPLFAGHVALEWPDEPHLVLWHAQTLLREFRGDGHIAALVTEGLNGLDALISHGASGDVPAPVLQATRAYSDDEWAAGVASMAERGLVTADGAATDAGRAQRERIEDLTDRLAAAPWQALGADRCKTLRAMGRVLSAKIVESGLMNR